MSNAKPDCAARVYDDRAGSFPCYRKGPIQENGKSWCFQHAPSKVAERRTEADKRYTEKWKGIEAAKLQAENRIWNEAIGVRRGGMNCKTCKWLEVEPDKRGRRVVRKQNAYPCVAPEPEKPKLPASAEVGYRSFVWPPHRSFMCGDMGEDCLCWEPVK